MEGNDYKCEMALEDALKTTTNLIATITNALKTTTNLIGRSTYAIETTLKPNNGCKKK